MQNDPNAAIERTLQDKQDAVASLINDAVACLARGGSLAAKAALRQRAERLSPSGRRVSRFLTKLILDCRYPRSEQPRSPGAVTRQNRATSGPCRSSPR